MNELVFEVAAQSFRRDLAKVLCARWGYAKVNQVGSHMIL